MDAAIRKLIFALDVPDLETAVSYVERLKGRVGMFKLGLELFTACGPEALKELANHDGSIMLDLKMHDIPATVARTVEVVNRYPNVRLLTVHVGDDPTPLTRACEVAREGLDIVGVSVLTSVLNRSPSLRTLIVGRVDGAVEAGCPAVVCSGLELPTIRKKWPDLKTIVPGIRLQPSPGSDDQQRVVTPQQAVQAGATWLVVGRAIRDAPDPAAAADHIVSLIAGAVKDDQDAKQAT